MWIPNFSVKKSVISEFFGKQIRDFPIFRLKNPHFPRFLPGSIGSRRWKNDFDPTGPAPVFGLLRCAERLLRRVQGVLVFGVHQLGIDLCGSLLWN